LNAEVKERAELSSEGNVYNTNYIKIYFPQRNKMLLLFQIKDRFDVIHILRFPRLLYKR